MSEPQPNNTRRTNFLSDVLFRAAQEAIIQDIHPSEPKLDKEQYQIQLQEQIAKDIGVIKEASQRLAMKFTIEGTHMPFDKVYQNADVAAGAQNVQYYLFEVMENQVLLVDKISTNWYSQCLWELDVDGDIIERGQRVIGRPADSPSNFPMQLEYPYIVTKYIRFRATNNSTLTHNFGAVCQGLIVPKRHSELMGGTKTRVG